MRTALLIGLIVNFLTSNSFAGQSKITLDNVSKSDDGFYVFKSYMSDDTLRVNYSYGENTVDDTQYNNVLHLTFIESSGDLFPVDIIKTGFLVAGDLDLSVRKLGIILNPPQGCDFEGQATLKLNKMMLAIPEYPAGMTYTAKITEIFSSTKPKLVCE